MIPHISFTEILEAALVCFGLGIIAGTWMTYKLDSAFRSRRKNK